MKYILSIIIIFSLCGCSASFGSGGFIAPGICLVFLLISVYNWVKGKEYGDSGLTQFGIFGSIASLLGFIATIILMGMDK